MAIAAAQAKHIVYGIDIDKKIIEDLRRGIHPVPGIRKELVLKLINSNNYFPTKQNNVIHESDIVIMAVPTPLDSLRNPDLSALKQACESVAKFVSNDTLIINESTSYPGTLRNFIKPIFDSFNLLNLEYASAPERVDPGNEIWKIENTPRVISGLSELATQRAIKFYSSFCQQVYQVKTPEIAEASKLFENTFRQVNIALSNEFSNIAHNLGFTANEAIQAASTKPFGFMPFYPSIGVGGHCIPIDPTYLSYAAQLSGVEAKIIDLANIVNISVTKNLINRLRVYVGGSFKGIKIQIAGISYKKNVSDLRESPALILLNEFQNQGALVSWCDPLVQEFNGMRSKPLDPDIDLGLIVTPHDQIDYSIWLNAQTKVLDLSANAIDYGWPKFL